MHTIVCSCLFVYVCVYVYMYVYTRYIRFQLSVTELFVFLVLDWLFFLYLVHQNLRKNFVWATSVLELAFTHSNTTQL